MIPLSNGKSPRIDHFYASLRSLKHNFIQSPQKQTLQEDRSIEHIRSLGKQILSKGKTSKGKLDSALKTFNKSRELPEKYDNLYDKYKGKNKDLDGRLIQCRKQQILQLKEKSKQKLWKNKRYENTNSKFQQTLPVKTLNYVKRTEMKAQQIKKIKVQKQKTEKQIKKKQLYYNRNKQSKPLKGLLQRSIEMEMRKSLSIEKIRDQMKYKQMEGVTFTPTKFSKDILKNSKSFMERLSMNELRKLSKQKQILKKTISSYQFKPYINPNKKVESVIKPIWASEEQWKQLSQNDEEQIKYKTEQQQQPTMHSTTRITLKNMNELSFMLE